MEKIIEIKNLCKSYGNISAVKNIDFYVEKGKMFAFLGPNGAGKSTTIDILCTFLNPDRGIVKVDNLTLGKNDTEIRKIIGAVFQDGLLDNFLTIKENLKIRGGFYGLHGEKLEESVIKTAEITGIRDLLNRPYGKLSGGQRRRCDIARALINTPKILFLDEPTTGLDPQTRKVIWETIAEIQKKSGMTIFLTTHYMEEASVADYVIVIDNGEIAARGTPSELKEQFSNDKLIISSKNIQYIAEILSKKGLVFEISSDTVEINLGTTPEALPILEACKGEIASFEVLKGTMDDVFIAITGKEIREC